MDDFIRKVGALSIKPGGVKSCVQAAHRNGACAINGSRKTDETASVHHICGRRGGAAVRRARAAGRQDLARRHAGYHSGRDQRNNIDAFRTGMHTLGDVEGQNLAIEYRSAEAVSNACRRSLPNCTVSSASHGHTRNTGDARAKDAGPNSRGDGGGRRASRGWPSEGWRGPAATSRASAFTTQLAQKRVELLKELVPKSPGSAAGRRHQPQCPCAMGQDQARGAIARPAGDDVRRQETGGHRAVVRRGIAKGVERWRWAMTRW